MTLPKRMLLLLWSAAAIAGCTGVEPALIGAVASGGEAGMAFWQRGRLYSAHATDGQAVRDAALAAADELQLHVRDEEHRRGYLWSILVEDDQRRDYRFRIDERSARLTQLEINVGWFGSRATAELLLQHVLAELETQMPAEPQVVPMPQGP